jgi:hypothetical protein
MKKSSNLSKVLTLLLISSLSMTVMNCSKAADVSPSVQIVGTWKIINIFTKEGSAAEIEQFSSIASSYPCVKYIIYTFKSNGDFTSSVPDDCKDNGEDILGTFETAKYEVKDGKLILTDTNGSKIERNISFSGSELTLIRAEVDQDFTIRFLFTKQ